MKILITTEYLDTILYSFCNKIAKSHEVFVLVKKESLTHKLNKKKLLFHKIIPCESKIDGSFKEKFNRIILSFKPDVVQHFHGNKYLSNINAVMLNHPKVLYSAYRGFVGNMRLIKNPETLFLHRHKRIDVMVSVSKAVGNYVRSLFPRYYLGVEDIHHGLDVSYQDSLAQSSVNLRENLGISNHEFIVGYVGNIRKLKRFDLLVKAVKSSDKKLKVLAVGDLKKWSKKLRNDDRFVFVGEQKNPCIYMEIFNLGVMCSEKEGLGRAALEMMCCSVPLVVSETEGLKEVIEHNKSGLFFKNKNWKDLRMKLEILMEDSEKTQAMGEMARKRIVNHFSVDRMVSDYSQIYSKYLIMKKESFS